MRIVNGEYIHPVAGTMFAWQADMSTSFRPQTFATIVATALSVSACSYDCGTVMRTLVDGTVRDAQGVTLATVQADLSDNLRPSFFQLSVGVTGGPTAGEPLKGHVTAARLVTESGELIAEIPTSTETLYLTVVVALNLHLPSRSEYERIRALLLTNKTKVILETDLPGREHIETTLTGAHDEPGQINRCSPA